MTIPFVPVSPCARSVFSKQLPRRCLTYSSSILPSGFHFFPSFLDKKEQIVLLQSALRKLDEAGKRSFRRKRKPKGNYHGPFTNVSDVFLPDEFYEFEEGHFDGVIVNYREMHVAFWPDEPLLAPILKRIYSLMPAAPEDIQAHLLHLSSRGHILPHIDNLEASGAFILGISLGDERILRMDNTRDINDSFNIVLPSGSAYLQSHVTRYCYKHSILPNAISFKDKQISHAQRLSIMLRDRI